MRQPNSDEEVLFVESIENLATGEKILASTYGIGSFRIIVKKRT